MPRLERRVTVNSDEDLRRRLVQSEAMVTRFAERIRAFQAVHTMRVEETGIFIGFLSVLYREWLDREKQDGPARVFVRWVESQTAESLVALLVGQDPSSYLPNPPKSDGGTSPDENGDSCDE
jgi:hypothetical protein